MLEQPTSDQIRLFEKGKAVLASLAGHSTAENISLEKAYEIYKADILKCDNPTSLAQSLILDPGSYFVSSDVFPSSQYTYESYKESTKLLTGVVDDLINDIEDDPHLKRYIVSLYDLLVSKNINPTERHTTTEHKSQHLVLIGTGSGLIAAKLINYLKPSIITIIVDDWHDWASSFFSIDWLNIWNHYCTDPDKRIFSISASEPRSLQSYIAIHLLPLLDHALIYKSSYISQSADMLHSIFSDGNLQRQINYLGFIMDEYNMIYNSAKSLANTPRVYTNPGKSGFGGRYLVCASGPSLDNCLDQVKRLSDSSIIVACASSYGSLREAGIRVDFLCLLERGDFMIEQYTEASKRYAGSETRLLASVTTPAELHQLFKEPCIYFRPALTPVSIYAESSNQILINEGPQTVNTGVAFAIALGANEIILCGADLGVRALSNVRSKYAIGDSPRDFPITVKGNKSCQAYTNPYLLDGASVLTQIAETTESDNISLLNASDGIEIKGWNPVDLTSLNARTTDYPLDIILQWWGNRPRYNIDLAASMWLSADPRSSLLKVSKSIIEILRSDTTLYPSAIMAINRVLAIHEGKQYEQIGPRIIRGFVLKSLCLLYRQVIIISSQSISPSEFETAARQALADQVTDITSEIIELFDKIELMIDGPSHL